MWGSLMSWTPQWAWVHFWLCPLQQAQVSAQFRASSTHICSWWLSHVPASPNVRVFCETRLHSPTPLLSYLYGAKPRLFSTAPSLLGLSRLLQLHLQWPLVAPTAPSFTWFSRSLHAFKTSTTITKLGCQREVQPRSPLEHLCVLTLGKHFPDFTSAMPGSFSAPANYQHQFSADISETNVLTSVVLNSWLLFWFGFFGLFVFVWGGNKVSLCNSPGYPGICFVGQVLDLTEIPCL